MNPTDSGGFVAAALVVSILTLVVGLAYYVWYALALSKTFPKLASDGWKGWVPILNEAEILRLGGVPAWSVIYYFIPIVQLYGLYLKITAINRINLQLQRGVGATVLGILLPPVWASLLAWGRAPASEFDQRVSSMRPGQLAAGVGPLSAPAAPPSVPIVRDASGYIVPPPAPQAPVVPEPVLPVPAAPVDRVETPPGPVSIVNPWAPRGTDAPATAETPSVNVPPLIRAIPSTRIELPPIASDPVAAVPVIPDPPVSSIPSLVDDVDDDDEFAATVVVDRRPRVLWRLVLDTGTALDLTADKVALGRNPASEDPDAQLLSVPDSTRTLSKTHATLELNDGQWTVTDLNSTNGVIVVGAQDAETLLAPGRSAPVPDRFILGRVGMRVEFVDGAAR